QTLSRSGFKYLAPRAFNQDYVENLFSQIRQHRISNTNPTCHHFIAALKTVIVNALGKQFIRRSNCEDDGCTPITGLAYLLHNSYDSKPNADDKSNNYTILCAVDKELINKITNDEKESQASVYVTGHLLNKTDISNCDGCHLNFFSSEINNEHVWYMS
ncbi:hypothetical protein ILUMI_14467, partial [Ignelater luminosus]